MRDRLPEFGDDVRIALVTFTDADALSTYASAKDLGYPVLRDPERAAYRLLGFDRTTFARAWGWKAIRRYLQLFREGRWRDLHAPVEDTRQLGGDVVIDTAGTVTWIYRSEGPDDRPTVEVILAAVNDARSGVA